MNTLKQDLLLIQDEHATEAKLLTDISWLEVSEKTQILQAMQFCKQKHAGQFRDEWVPYFSHPFFVAILWIREWLSTEDIIVLLLHDTLEDTDTTKEEISALFSPRIAEKVYFLSKNFFEKEEYYQNIASSSELQILKGLDRLANLHSLHYADVKKQEQYKQKTKKEILPILDHTSSVYKKILELLQ